MNPVRNSEKNKNGMKIENTQRNRKGDISNGVKKILIALGLGIVVFAPHALAQGFVPLAEIPGLTKGVVADSAGLAQFFNNLYLYLIGFAAMLAIIEIIWGGLLYSTTDSISNKEEGKEKIRMAIFGLILVLSPVLVFSIINPSILNLSLKLEPIDLKTPAITSTEIATSSLPQGGTSYKDDGKGPGVSAGKWCFSATTQGGNFGKKSEFQCWPDNANCASVLSDVKSNPTKYAFSVSGGAACIERLTY